MSAGPTAADGSPAGATRGPVAPPRMAFPDNRPAGRVLGATPPIAHRSLLRGVNGTVTRPPGANAILSAAWAIASSYWTVGRTRPSAAWGSLSAPLTVAAGTLPTRISRPAAKAISRGRALPPAWTWRRADITSRSLPVRGNAQPPVPRIRNLRHQSAL